jgi:hypothetical protein
VKPELLRAKKRLARNLIHLGSYCSPGGWPAREFLAEIQHDVLVLAARKRPIRPVWKAFEQVDQHEKRLRLKSHINDLIRRARNLLSGKSQLAKTVREAKTKGNAEAQCLLRRWAADPQKFAELLGADRLWVIQWCNAQDLVRWTLSIRHPNAKDLHWIAKFLPTVEESRRQKRRESVRRSRSRKKISSDSVTRFYGYTREAPSPVLVNPPDSVSSHRKVACRYLEPNLAFVKFRDANQGESAMSRNLPASQSGQTGTEGTTGTRR